MAKSKYFLRSHSFFAFILLLSLPLTLKAASSAPNIFLIYGSSCAGKSTLAKELQRNLGPEWCYLDWDDYENQVGNEYATEALLDTIKEELVSGKHLIVDTQPCINWNDALSHYHVATILVYAPLTTLIARDKTRQAILKRPEQRRRYARAYIYETYHLLYGFDYLYDRVDQISSSDLECDIFKYPLKNKTRKFFEKIAQTLEAIPIYTKIPFDLILRTDNENTLDHMALIRSKFFDN